LPRTTNSVEAWHGALRHSLPTDHSVIWKVIEVVLEEFSLSTAHAASSQLGSKRHQNKKYQKLTKEIQDKAEELREGDIGTKEFLKFVSHKINFVC